MAECSRTLHRSANVMRRPVWARFAAIDHRSTDPREFQIASFTLGFIVAHKSWSFLRANKTADVRNAAAGIIAAHQATVADNFLLWRNSIATQQWRRHAIVIPEIVLAAWLPVHVSRFTNRPHGHDATTEFLPVASFACRRNRVITARENGARVYPLPKMSGMRDCISCTVYRGFQNTMNTRARGADPCRVGPRVRRSISIRHHPSWLSLLNHRTLFSF